MFIADGGSAVVQGGGEREAFVRIGAVGCVVERGGCFSDAPPVMRADRARVGRPRVNPSCCGRKRKSLSMCVDASIRA